MKHDQLRYTLPYRASSPWKWMVAPLGVIFPAFGIGIALTSSDVASIAIGVVVTLVGIFALLSVLRRGVVLNKAGLTTHNILFNTRKATWSEIEGFELTDGSSILPISTVVPAILIREEKEPLLLSPISYYSLRKGVVPHRVQKVREIIEAHKANRTP
ncbi:hypothetical protein [Amycolatopsis anabasis]|uniref:hypothetical protein n=1 Tax=Amycolatopsis anabasis TaxID=1840409 RepID=UPI00131E9379|nr:hypothetical protein [Amycolatopsis anabasis]